MCTVYIYIHKNMFCIFLGGIMFNAGWKICPWVGIQCTSHWLFPLVLGPWHARLIQMPCCYVHKHKPTWNTTWPLCSIDSKDRDFCRASSPKPTLAWPHGLSKGTIGVKTMHLFIYSFSSEHVYIFKVEINPKCLLVCYVDDWVLKFAK